MLKQFHKFAVRLAMSTKAHSRCPCSLEPDSWVALLYVRVVSAMAAVPPRFGNRQPRWSLCSARLKVRGLWRHANDLSKAEAGRRMAARIWDRPGQCDLGQNMFRTTATLLSLDQCDSPVQGSTCKRAGCQKMLALTVTSVVRRTAGSADFQIHL